MADELRPGMMRIEEKDIICWAISEGYQQIAYVLSKNNYHLKSEYNSCFYQNVINELLKYRGDFTEFHRTLCSNLAVMFENLLGHPDIGIIQLWINTLIKLLTNTKQCASVRKFFAWKDDEIHVPLSDELFKKIKMQLNFNSQYINYFTYEKLTKYDDYLYLQEYLKKHKITGINTTLIINKQVNNGSIERISSLKGLIKEVDTTNTNLYFGDSVKVIGGLIDDKDKEYYQKYTIYPVCKNNYDIESIKMADTVKEIGQEAFMNCYSLKEVTLSSKLVKIGKDAFKGCVSLTSIIIPESVKIIEPGAFDDCTNLKSVRFLGNYITVCKACDFRVNFNNCSSEFMMLIESDRYSIEGFRKNFGYYLRVFHPNNSNN